MHEANEPNPDRYPPRSIGNFLRHYGIEATVDRVDYVNNDVNIRIAEGRLKKTWDPRFDATRIPKGKTLECFDRTTGAYLRIYRTKDGKDVFGFYLSYGRDPHPPELRKYPFEREWQKAVQRND